MPKRALKGDRTLNMSKDFDISVTLEANGCAGCEFERSLKLVMGANSIFFRIIISD